MSMPCPVCANYHGHNQEEHNRVHEALLHKLEQRVEALEALSNESGTKVTDQSVAKPNPPKGKQ